MTSFVKPPINDSRTCAPHRAILEYQSIRTRNGQSRALELVLADHLALQVVPKGLISAFPVAEDNIRLEYNKGPLYIKI